MSKKSNELNKMRNAAEAGLAIAENPVAPIRPAEELLHDLQVHQIELSMQNDELRRSHVIIEEMRDRFVDLYEFAPVGYITLSREGMITESNLTGASLLGVERKKLLNKRFAHFIRTENSDQWNHFFLDLLHRDGRQSCELEIQRSEGSYFLARIVSLKSDDSLSSHEPDDRSGDLRVRNRSTQLRIVIYDITEEAQANKERVSYMKRLVEISRHLISVQEDMRRRLSRELHDRTSPNLAVIGINLKTIATKLPPEVIPMLAELLEDTRALIVDTGESIREVCADMRPPLLDYAGLAAAVEGYGAIFTRRTGIKFNFCCLNHDVRLTRDLESLLFRIFQEAVTNCAKYAQPKSVTVILNHGSRPIFMEISDDGVGFDLAQLGKARPIGMGLLNMREMAEVIGGRFTIESDTGNGTRIAVVIS